MNPIKIYKDRRKAKQQRAREKRWSQIDPEDSSIFFCPECSTKIYWINVEGGIFENLELNEGTFNYHSCKGTSLEYEL